MSLNTHKLIQDTYFLSTTKIIKLILYFIKHLINL